jgi:hypothetical protein
MLLSCTINLNWDPVFWIRDILVRSGCGSGSPALLLSDLQGGHEKKNFFNFFLLEGTFISFFKDKKSQKYKSRVFLLFLCDDGRILIWIRIRTSWLTDQDPGGKKNICRNTPINPNFSSSGSVSVSNDRSWGARKELKVDVWEWAYFLNVHTSSTERLHEPATPNIRSTPVKYNTLRFSCDLLDMIDNGKISFYFLKMFQFSSIFIQRL